MTTATNTPSKKMDEFIFEHSIWMKELEFYKNELKIFNKRLVDICGSYKNAEVLARLEQFQNKFIVHNEVSDILRHDLKKHENELTEVAKGSVLANEQKIMLDHPLLRDRMESFIKIYRQLREDYLRYLADAMS
jgi:hypothetical protein